MGSCNVKNDKDKTLFIAFVSNGYDLCDKVRVSSSIEIVCWLLFLAPVDRHIPQVDSPYWLDEISDYEFHAGGGG